MKKTLLALIIFTTTNLMMQGQTLMVGWGASWKYLDDGSNQGNSWTQIAFNDASWNSGNAELGYGDGDETTTVSYGPSSSNKYITTYFRQTFNVSNPSQYTQLLGELVRDDGAVVYINGVEVFRSNMPGGNIGHTTLASGTIGFPFEDDIHTFATSASLLINGNNVICVEVHQENTSSSDISFKLQLNASTAPILANVVRGPYLQMATPTSMIIRWRTDVACDSRVNFDVTPTSFYQTAVSPNWGTEHIVQISGLAPWTTYYYNIGTNNTVLFGDPDMYFRTNPQVGDQQSYRFWAIGDAGEVSTGQRLARDAYYNFNGAPHADAWIMLGDNAYDGGSDSEYQNAVFDNMYDQLLMNTPLFPSPGNHDYNNNPFSSNPPYYDIFSLPAQGESGGLPSGTEHYYSWDFGNTHFISLDSYDENRDSTGAMANWLQADLAATTQTWIIAYWHHPPYTKGTHDSDNPLFYDFEMVEMREQILPLLENGGVDLVLCGHSHVYERSPLIDGHYGNSGSFNTSHIIDPGSGDYSVGCPYQKETQPTTSHQGTVYAVVGCSGKTGSTQSSWPHPAMLVSTNNEIGTMILDVNHNRLDAKFLTTNGIVYDQFTIVKDAGHRYVYQVCPGDTVNMIPSWPGTHNWTPGNFPADSLVFQPILSTYFLASDAWGCITDTFDITILPSPPCPPITGISAVDNSSTLSVIPNPANHARPILVNVGDAVNDEYEINIYDASGRVAYADKKMHSVGSLGWEIDPALLPSGMYFIRITSTQLTLSTTLIIE